MEQAEPQVPHVVFLLIPALGHIKPMLKLAEFLSRASFQVTFINTQRIHDRLLSTDLLARYPEFQFLTIPDVVPRDRPRSGTMCPGDFLLATGPVIKPALRQLLISLCKKKGRWQPATCIIEDGLLSSSVIDVAEEFQVPVFAFRTLSACCIWTYFHVPKLVEEGDFPVVQDKDMDKPVTCIPGLENVVRRRDLPGIFRIERADDPGLEFFINDQTLIRTRELAKAKFLGRIKMEQTQPRVPHVVLLPFPSLGHIKPLLSLAELLSHASFQVTFLNPQQIHDRLLISMDMPAFYRRHPEFEFLSMPDPVRRSSDRPRPGLFSLHDNILSLGSVIKPALGELLISFNRERGRRQPATCIIADGLLSSPVIDVAEQFEIPFFALRTSSACCIWAYFNLPKLVEEGDVPFQVADEDMDKLVTCIPGLENVVRRRDLPGIFRIERANDPALEYFINDQTLVLPRASGHNNSEGKK
ncbi:hypothetical protein QQP08_015802 [Theobroma cacao]|nr:hypothetical protein QQP08_015802 [Theobroma cacao]